MSNHVSRTASFVAYKAADGTDAEESPKYSDKPFAAFIDISQSLHHVAKELLRLLAVPLFMLESDGAQLIHIDTFTDDESVI